MNVIRSELDARSRSRMQFHAELPDGSNRTHVAPDVSVLQAELATKIQFALTQLTPQLRVAIVLVCLQGTSAADAAAIENCSTDTMYWRVHEARKQLRKLLADHLQ